VRCVASSRASGTTACSRRPPARLGFPNVGEPSNRRLAGRCDIAQSVGAAHLDIVTRADDQVGEREAQSVSSHVRGPAERSRWLGVEFRHLAALAAVADEGSFGRAAATLGYVQSAISQQIAFLERLVGSRLVDRKRGPRPVTLTRAGEMMLTHTAEILAELGAAQLEFDALTRATEVSLRVGVCESVAVEVMPELLGRARTGLPELCLTTHQHDTGDLPGLIESGALDVALGVLPLPGAPFATRELLSDPYVLLVHSDSPLARRGRLESLDELGATELVACSAGSGAPGDIEAQFRACGTEPPILLEVDLTATIEAFVAGGVGAAIGSQLAVGSGTKETAVVELHDLIPPRTIGMFWRCDHERADAICRFAALTSDVCADLEARRVVPLPA
jgi:DNA-binding transcriptional LysR family regulator